jgi:hypothetical protein
MSKEIIKHPEEVQLTTNIGHSGIDCAIAILRSDDSDDERRSYRRRASARTGGTSNKTPGNGGRVMPDEGAVPHKKILREGRGVAGAPSDTITIGTRRRSVSEGSP